MTLQELEKRIQKAKERQELVLDLSMEGIEVLPASIGQLRQLQELHLQQNRLVHLPETIGRLRNLRHLFVHDNYLTELPQTLLKLARRNSLRVISLHGNYALDLPLEVLGPPWRKSWLFEPGGKDPATAKSVLEYYFRVRDGSRPLNEAKLILVGRGEVGKTCVANRLIRDQFVDTSKTEGIQITQWLLDLPDTGMARLHVWDFGGQEIMHATHQFFLSQRSLYLLVISGRAGGEDAEAEYWLQLAESFGGGSPVIVVLNKIIEHPFDLNRRALEQKYPSIREFIAVDCKDGLGFDKLTKAIRRETSRLEGLRASFPKTWFSIKDHLASMAERGEDFLSYERYSDLCKKLGESEPDAQSQLASYLHSLGVALNYKDDPRLLDTHVLSPHWVTNGIYKILNWPLLEKQKGVLKIEELSTLLDKQKCPQSKHSFLLDLMKKFEICFEFPDDRQRRYLIPELLDKQEPSETAQFTPTDSLNFQYVYELLPEGLLPRFIVRTHTLSEGCPRWRTGVVLGFEQNFAIVKADVQARKIFVSVAGPVEGRRGLLAVIRADFTRIHGDIRKLHVKEMVPMPGRHEIAIPYQELLDYESAGDDEYKVVIDRKPVKWSVKALLSGIDTDDSRKQPSLSKQDVAPLVFISYSHKDESLREELETHLKLLKRQKKIETWTDRKIIAGEKWAGEIDRNLEEADIVILLVSADFLASDYCWDKELARALERESAGETIVVPIIVRDSDWQSAPFAKCQALPKDAKPITLWPDRDTAWKDVAQGISRAVEKRESRRERR